MSRWSTGRGNPVADAAATAAERRRLPEPLRRERACVVERHAAALEAIADVEIDALRAPPQDVAATDKKRELLLAPTVVGERNARRTEARFSIRPPTLGSTPTSNTPHPRRSAERYPSAVQRTRHGFANHSFCASAANPSRNARNVSNRALKSASPSQQSQKKLYASGLWFRATPATQLWTISIKHLHATTSIRRRRPSQKAPRR